MKNRKMLAVGIYVGIPVLLVLGVGVWKWKNIQKAKVAEQNTQQQQVVQPQQQNQKFVVDVDQNVDNWQTKETEFFTIKFPKEWYWMESDLKKTGYHSRIVTNNPDFDIVKYADIGLGTGSNYPLTLTNNAEVIITYSVSATSDAGTPQDRINSIFKLAKQYDPSAKCSVSNNKTIPFIVYCTATYNDSQLQQTYHIINEGISLAITIRTTNNTLIKKEILDKIIGSIVLKQHI
jgi:cytoskeletal protein RodZ